MSESIVTTHLKKEDNCGNCAYFRAQNDGSTEGMCVCYPPKAHWDTVNRMFMSGYPVVFFNSYACGMIAKEEN
jgi:hypothetical protein